jgi:hypothetical protein
MFAPPTTSYVHASGLTFSMYNYDQNDNDPTRLVCSIGHTGLPVSIGRSTGHTGLPVSIGRICDIKLSRLHIRLHPIDLQTSPGLTFSMYNYDQNKNKI